MTRNLRLAAFAVIQTLVSTFKSQYRVEIRVLQHSQQPSIEHGLFQPNVLSTIEKTRKSQTGVFPERAVHAEMVTSSSKGSSAERR